MLKALMSFRAIIFKFELILHKIFFVVRINCSKKDFAQNLPNFKITGATEVLKCLKDYSFLIFQFRRIWYRTIFIVRVDCNEKGYVQNLSNIKI